MSSGAWQRFLDQKTAAQRLLIAVAGIVAALVTIGGGIYAASTLVGDDGDRDGGAGDGATVAGERIEQGTDGADELIRRLLAAAGGRVKLDRRISAPAGEVPFTDGDIRLHYNCKGRPAGTDNCNVVRLQVPSDPPPQIIDKTVAYFNGTYAISLAPGGAVYGTDFDVAFDDLAQ